jgi:hypothetical protein
MSEQVEKKVEDLTIVEMKVMLLDHLDQIEVLNRGIELNKNKIGVSNQSVEFLRTQIYSRNLKGEDSTQ